MPILSDPTVTNALCDPAVSNAIHPNDDVASSSGASSSRNNIDVAFPSPPLTAVDSVAVFYDNIVRSRGTGIRSSCFSSDVNVILGLGRMHGIEIPCESSLVEKQYLVLRHLLLGDCVRHFEVNSSLPRGSRRDIICGQMCQSFPSPTDMSMAFIRRIIEDLTEDQKLSTPRVAAVASAFSNSSYNSQAFSSLTHVKRDALRLFKGVVTGDTVDDSHILPARLESMTKIELQTFARSHSIQFVRAMSVSDLRELIVTHVLSSACLRMVSVDDWDRSPPGCAKSMRLFLTEGLEPDNTAFVVFALSRCTHSMSLKPLRRVLQHLEVPFDSSDSLNQLRRRLSVYVSRIEKNQSKPGSDISWKNPFVDLVHTWESWPQLISSANKDKICNHFLKLTGMSALKSGVCASCSESCSDQSLKLVLASSLNLDLLCRPDQYDSFADGWLDSDVVPPQFPFQAGVLNDILVNPQGVTGQGLETTLALCRNCHSSLMRGRVPDLALRITCIWAMFLLS